MAGLFLWSATQILKQAIAEIREAQNHAVPAE